MKKLFQSPSVIVAGIIILLAFYAFKSSAQGKPQSQRCTAVNASNGLQCKKRTFSPTYLCNVHEKAKEVKRIDGVVADSATKIVVMISDGVWNDNSKKEKK